MDEGNAYHVVTGSDTDSTAILDGFTIEAGYATSPAPFDRGLVYIYFPEAQPCGTWLSGITTLPMVVGCSAMEVPV